MNLYLFLSLSISSFRSQKVSGNETPYKEALKTRFHQEEVLITMQELTIL